MVEFSIPKTKIEKSLDKTYNIIAKGIHTSFMAGIYTMRFIMVDMTKYTENQIEKLKNKSPLTTGEKIENNFISFGHFCGGLTGFCGIPLIYYAVPEIAIDTIEELTVTMMFTPFTLDVGQIAGAYTSKILADYPKEMIDDVLIPTYENIKDTLTTKINSITDKVYQKIKNNIQIKIK